MNRVRWQDHVALSKDLHSGDACIKGTRIPVQTLIASLADGMTTEEILREYSQLSPEDLLGALAYAADVLSQNADARQGQRPSFWEAYENYRREHPPDLDQDIDEIFRDIRDPSPGR